MTPTDDQTLREACGLVDRPADHLELTGPDRLRFLNGLVTCEVKALEPGRGVYGFITQVKGRILADVAVLALDDRLWLGLPAGRGAAIAEHLGKYVIFDPVEIAIPEDRAVLAVAGPRSAALLADLAGDVPREPLDHRTVEIGGAEVLLACEDGLGVPMWSLRTPAPTAVAVAAALLEAGAVRVGREAFEVLRVEAGRPLWGRDYDDENFPQETGLDDAVSYTKGCYLGQEVVARIHYRGGVNKLLRGLRFAEGAEPLGGSVVHDGREAGRVTSAVVSPVHGAIGLAVLYKRVEPGMRVELEGGGEAEVVELPFEPLQ